VSAVEGQVSGVGVGEVLRLICQRRLPTELTVMRNGATGRVVVGEGEIVHARVGDLSGERAVVELLRWREGIFKVRPAPSLPERNVRSPLTELLVRAARLGPALMMSGMQAANDSAPRSGDQTADRSLDKALDESLVDLFARLEREVARFEGLRPGGRGLQAVPILEALLARIVDVASRHLEPSLGDAELRAFLLRQGEITPSFKLASVDKGRISLEVFRDLLGSSSLGEGQRRQLFGELTAGTLGLVNGLFARICKRLASEELRQQWQETLEAFLTDLTAAFDTVKL
jgi:Domain of unknown function (DUF4388)